MSAYSLDLRERIVAACCAGQSHVSVAASFGVCSKTVQRYVARARRGELAPRPLPARAPRLAKQDEANFVAMLQETSNWTLFDLSSKMILLANSNRAFIQDWRDELLAWNDYRISADVPFRVAKAALLGQLLNSPAVS